MDKEPNTFVKKEYRDICIAINGHYEIYAKKSRTIEKDQLRLLWEHIKLLEAIRRRYEEVFDLNKERN